VKDVSRDLINILAVSLPIQVTAYSGYRANERPSDFVLDEDLYEIAAVEDHWYEPDAMYFRVGTTEGRRYILRYDESEDEWSLQNGFDGDELLARQGIEVITVDADVIRRAEQEIESCEHCHPDDAEIPFDWILRDVTGKHGPHEFMLTEPARCPNCKQPLTQKTLLGRKVWPQE
jgi:hypothetical protein